MCTGRVDLEFVLRAFSKGMDGVFIGGCRLNECNYITHGNFQALSMVFLCKKIMRYIGLNPDRLRIEFMTSGDGMLFAEIVNNFVKKVKELGPLGKGEGIGEHDLKSRLEAVTNLVPYIRLVERERLRVKFDNAEKYKEFYDSAELDKLFQETIGDKIAISQIIVLLREKPLTTGEIAESLGFNPSEVSKYLNNSARQGLIWFDEKQKRFAPV
jgi:F420-non-reducing hydrogenase iron-sulfur subunit